MLTIFQQPASFDAVENEIPKSPGFIALVPAIQIGKVIGCGDDDVRKNRLAGRLLIKRIDKSAVLPRRLIDLFLNE
jgi:hypothetical protein